MTADQVSALERKLDAYDDSTSNQIVIVTVPTTGDYSIEDYALKYCATGGLGIKRTTTASSSWLPFRIIRSPSLPGTGWKGDSGYYRQIDHRQFDRAQFQGGSDDNYYRGFDGAVDDLIKAAAGEYKARRDTHSAAAFQCFGGNIIGLIVIIFIIIILSPVAEGWGRVAAFSAAAASCLYHRRHDWSSMRAVVVAAGPAVAVIAAVAVSAGLACSGGGGGASGSW